MNHDETKAQTFQRKRTEKPRPEKARSVRPNVKVLFTVYFDCNGVVHHEFLPQTCTVNKEFYFEIMSRFCEATCPKRTGLWRNELWTFHHYNAPGHTSNYMREFLAKNKTSNHGLTSVYMRLADFLLFPKLRTPTKQNRFATIEDTKQKSSTAPMAIPDSSEVF